MNAEHSRQDPLVFIIAGEHSGDVLGARLMAALKIETGGRIRFAGIGGERMELEGLKSLYPMKELALMGILEVLRHIPRLLKIIRNTVSAVRKARPAVLLTIDSPGLTLRMARRLKDSGIPLVHYVAPTVWAWKPGRASKIAEFLDRLLVVLPFEPPYFEVHGLKCDFVGHPAVEDTHEGNGAAFRARYGIAADAPLLCAMPGSRRSEIRRLMPIYHEAILLLKVRIPGLRIVIPTVADVHDAISTAVSEWPMPVTLVRETEEKSDAFSAANVALVKAGTSGLEVAIAGLPCVITQRVNWLTAWLARRTLSIQLFSLVNILLKREAQPELIQENCTPAKLAAALLELFENPQARRDQVECGRLAARMLGLGELAPSRRAALVVLEVLGKTPLDNASARTGNGYVA